MKSALSLLIPTLIIAGTDTSTDILNLFDEVSDIATEKKINIHDIPSTVEVLRQSELLALGVTNIAEALTLLSGVEVSMTETGQPVLIVRGQRSPESYNFDKVKLLIDSTEINSVHYATIEHYLTFPIELISRIEILRSSGSAMYGTGAFLGVINIVTKTSQADTNALSLGLGSYGYKYGGFNTYIQEDSYSLALDGYYQKNDKQLDAKGFAKYPQRFERAEETQENMKDLSLGLIAKYDKFTFKTRLKDLKTNIFYGVNERLTSADNGEKNNRKFFFAELGYQNKILKSSNFNIALGYSSFNMAYRISDQMSDEEFAFYSTYLPDFGSDVYADARLNEESYYLKSELNYRELKNHTMLFGASINYSKNKINNYYAEPFTQEKYDYFSPVLPSYLLIDGDYYSKQNLKREIGALYFQDLLELTPTLDLQVAVRFDKYVSEFTQTSYKVGALYKHTDNMNSKFSYATGFRAPTWGELYRVEATLLSGNPELIPESMQTYEYNFIYKANNHFSFNTNLYYSKIDDAIERSDDQFDFVNAPERTSKGLEISLRTSFFDRDTFVANYSYVDTEFNAKGETTEQQLPGVAQHLGNVYYIYRVNSDTSLSARYRYIGEREKNLFIVRTEERVPYLKNYPSYNTLDASISYKPTDSSEFILSVKNVFDSDIIFPSSENNHHETGLIREGRNFSLRGIIHF